MAQTVDLGQLPVQSPRVAATYVKVLVYGTSGVGKTTFAGSAEDIPEARRVLLIEPVQEKGTMTLAAQGRGEHLDVMQLMQFSATVDPVKNVVAAHGLDSIIKYLREVQHPYKTLVIDGIKGIQKLCLDGVMDVACRMDSKVNRDMPQLQHYGIVTNQMRRTLQAIVGLDMNIIFTCFQKEVKDELTGAISLKPDLMDQLSNELPGMVDIVGHLTGRLDVVNNVKVIRRALLVQPDGRSVAKDRSSGLGPVVEDPTFLKVYNSVQSVYATKQKETN